MKKLLASLVILICITITGELSAFASDLTLPTTSTIDQISSATQAVDTATTEPVDTTTTDNSIITTEPVDNTTTDTSSTDNSSTLIDVKPGINVDSPFYFLDKDLENIQLWLTPDQEKKSELLLSFAEERISELNSLPQDKVSKYADKLVEDYNNTINKANDNINTLILNNKLLDQTKLNLEEKLNDTVDIDQALTPEVQNEISSEVKTKLNDTKNNVYLTIIASGLTNDDITSLKNDGFSFGDILKINVLSTISGKSIEELKLLDIYNDSGEIDFSKVASLLGISEDDIMNQIKAYRDTVKEQINTELKENIQDKKDQILQTIENKREEIKQKFDDKINSKIEESKTELDGVISSKIDLNLQVLDLLVQQGLITADDKQTVLDQIDEIKTDMIAKIQNSDLNRNDYEQIGLEITQSIKNLLKDQLAEIDLSQVDISELDNEAIQALGNLLGNPQATVDNTLNMVVSKLQENGISLTDDQIQTIKSQINDQIASGEFNTSEFNSILKQIIDIIKNVLGNTNTDFLNNINQFKERYQERNSDTGYPISYDQQILDLFNNIVTTLNSDVWNQLLPEKQNEIRSNILSDIDLTLSQDQITAQIQEQLTAILNKQQTMDLFNNIVTTLNSDVWNQLRPEIQNEIRYNILSDIDLTLSQNQITAQIQEQLTAILNKQQTMDLFNNIVTTLNSDVWNQIPSEKQNEIRYNILSHIDLTLSQDQIKSIIKEQLTAILNKNQDNNEDHFNQIVTFDQQTLDLFSSTVEALNSNAWNQLPSEKQNQIRYEILSHIDLTLTQDQIQTKIQNALNEILTFVDAQHDDNLSQNNNVDLNALFDKITKEDIISTLWNSLTLEKQKTIKNDIVANINVNESDKDLHSLILNKIQEEMKDSLK